MKKDIALALLGKNTNVVGSRIGVTGQAVRNWPHDLPDRLVDRVVAAVVRDLVSASGNRRCITLPLELHRYLCRHGKPPNGANARHEFTPTATLDAGNYTNKPVSKRRSRVESEG